MTSIDAGISTIRTYLTYLDKRRIRWRIATAPIHRMAIALIYAQGLGPTFERHREALAALGRYVDLNLDFELTRDDGAFWDTHHLRDGARAIDDLHREDLVVTMDNVRATGLKLRPSQEETERLHSLRHTYAETWEGLRAALAKLNAL